MLFRRCNSSLFDIQLAPTRMEQFSTHQSRLWSHHPMSRCVARIRTVDPLESPINKCAHLMLPNPESIKVRSVRWSVCPAQQDFFSCLPLAAQLGCIISKIICSETFIPASDVMCSDFAPPCTFVLKTSLCNGLANRDFEIHCNSMLRDHLLVQAIRVADAILAGLNMTQVGYFFDGEPVEHVRDYVPLSYTTRKHASFVPQMLLCFLIHDYMSFHNEDTCSSQNIIDLIQNTLNAVMFNSSQYAYLKYILY